VFRCRCVCDSCACVVCCGGNARIARCSVALRRVVQ
jgi:hypothetical protein